MLSAGAKKYRNASIVWIEMLYSFNSSSRLNLKLNLREKPLSRQQL